MTRASPFAASALIIVALAIIFSMPVPAANPSPSVSEGQTTFNNHCRTCHSMKAGDNRQGPSLHGVFGAKAGHAPGYRYSSALAGSGLTWDAATLDKFIASPDSVVSNTNMKPYTGLTDAAVRKTIVEFLKSNGEG